jgi:hypothetical protein
MYNLINGTRITSEAPLKIWNWNGQNITLEKSQEWTTEHLTEIKSITINDVDNDEKIKSPQRHFRRPTIGR